MKDLKIAIDNESVNIYIENGEDKEPTHIVYWHADEWEEDASIVPSIFHAIELYYTNPKELLTRLKYIN